MKVRLPNTVSSQQDLSALTFEIREYAKWFAHNAIKAKVHAKNVTPPPTLSPSALELVRSAGGTKLLDQKVLDELILELEDAKKTAPTITVTLAAPATGDVKQNLVAACRQHINDNALVTFKFNAGLCGGMVISYGSHVFDWSFRRQILENRASFAEVLRRV
jgi:F0F1-type ATP synthase delta subunit